MNIFEKLKEKINDILLLPSVDEDDYESYEEDDDDGVEQYRTRQVSFVQKLMNFLKGDAYEDLDDEYEDSYDDYIELIKKTRPTEIDGDNKDGEGTDTFSPYRRFPRRFTENDGMLSEEESEARKQEHIYDFGDFAVKGKPSSEDETENDETDDTYDAVSLRSRLSVSEGDKRSLTRYGHQQIQTRNPFMLSQYRQRIDAKSIQTSAKSTDRRKTRIMQKNDFPLIVLIVMLLLIGLVVLFGISWDGEEITSTFSKQLVTVATGLAVMMIVSLVDYNHILRFRLPISFVIWILAISTIIISSFSPETSRAWLNIGGLTFNTVGLLHIPVLLLVPGIFNKGRELRMKDFMLIGLIAGISFVFAYIQNSFSLVMTIILIVALLMYVKKPVLFIVTTVCAVGLFVALSQTTGLYTPDRLKVWLDPFSDPQNHGWHTIQSLYTIASGGMFGNGLGSGIEIAYLPEATGGYFMSTIIYQLGIVGAIIVLALLVLVVFRIGLASAKANDSAGFYLGMAICIYFAISIILNALVVVNVIPPANFGGLPLVSYSGTKTLIDMSLLGIALNISKQSSERPIWSKGVQSK